MFFHPSFRRQTISLAFALTLGMTAPLAAIPGTNHHVILITIDGLSAEALTDSKAPLPTLRKLAADGAVAAGLRVSNPSVTWPNHTTLVTGVHADKHAMLFNGALVRPGPGQPVQLDNERDKKDLVAVPTLYDQLHQTGHRTAGINWPGTRRAPTLDDNFPDVPSPITYTTPRLRAQLIRHGLLASDSDAAFLSQGAAAGDQTWTGAAIHLIRNRPPNLLLLHLLITDTIQHKYGPESPAAYTAAGLADANIAEVLRAIDAANLRDRTTVFVTSDHGFARARKLINPNVVFRKAGLFRPTPRRRAQAYSEGGTAFVYLTEPATRAADRAKVIELLRDHEGIAEILGPESFAALHLPHPDQNPQMGDLLLVAKEDYAFSDEWFEEESITELQSPSGVHGYLSTNPKMNGIFIAAGRGIKPGVKLGEVEIIDVAPTIAALFGQKLLGADGKPLDEILAAAQKR
jgi:predicted AlkP superfamily pyrophosphatase or phosphodiesterase